jgi:hypothetical protein
MLVTTHSGQFGRHGQLGQVVPTANEEAATPGLINTVGQLSQQETQLRLTFAKLLPDLATLQATSQAVPSALLALLHKYNTAQSTFMGAARVWLAARAVTPASDLPDPNAQAIAIPTFDLPASGFGAADVPASAIRIRHGIVGREVSTGLGDFVNNGYSGHEGLGGPLGIAIVILVGLAIVGATIILTARTLQTSDTAAANQAIAAQSEGRVQEVKSDRDLFVTTRDACIGNSTDQQVRLTCIQSAADVLKIAKEGRPSVVKPVSPVTVGILTVLGVLSVVGIAGAAGYAIYKRKQHNDRLPSARTVRHSRPTHRRSHAAENTDEMY